MSGGPLVVGLDVGGSTTRVLLADLDGTVLGTARGTGGNPVSHGAAAAVRAVGDTVRRTLAQAGADPARVAAGVIGLAGGSVAGGALDVLWPELGLGCRPVLVGDAQLAYTAGTFEPDGTVLIAGTGAVAAECRAHSPVRTADGHGWLLGDLGSGYWLGRAAVVATLTEIDRAGAAVARADATPLPVAESVLPVATGPSGAAQGDPAGDDPLPAEADSAEGKWTALAAAVLDSLVGPRAPGANLRAAVISAAHAQAPVHLARLAPLVLDLAAVGDPAASALVGQAAGHLLDTLATVREPDSRRPIVLAGGILGPESPLTAAVRSRIAAHWPAAPLTAAGNPAGAAAWLAARHLGHADRQLHTALTRFG